MWTWAIIRTQDTFLYLDISYIKVYTNCNTMMLQHGSWTALPAPEADTEAQQTPARHGVGSFSMDQTRPVLRHATGGHLWLFGCATDTRFREFFSRIRVKNCWSRFAVSRCVHNLLCSPHLTPFWYFIWLAWYFCLLFFKRIKENLTNLK